MVSPLNVTPERPLLPDPQGKVMVAMRRGDTELAFVVEPEATDDLLKQLIIDLRNAVTVANDAYLMASHPKVSV